ncbi:MAG: TerB family tellurite resistance protein, partial [Acidobacteriota bacterium]
MLQKLQSFLKDRLQSETSDQGPARAEIAALALLVELSRADFEVTPSELEAIETAGARLLRSAPEQARDLLAEARQQADDSVSLYDFTAEIHREFDAEEKKNVILELWRVAWADGSIAPHEDHLVR